MQKHLTAKKPKVGDHCSSPHSSSTSAQLDKSYNPIIDALIFDDSFSFLMAETVDT